jgi:asparagine synthetase B (glutamine-hydrolysing)
VLALRGDHITRQPLESDNGSVLCWNGEAWRVNGQRIQAEANDAEVVLKLLVNVGSSAPGDERLETLLNALRAIEGPFAFVYYDYPAETLIYGRDRLGRRSLVLRQDGDELELCSVAGSLGNGWQEVEADGIYVARLKTQGGLDISRCPWIVGDKTADFVSRTLACEELYTSCNTVIVLSDLLGFSSGLWPWQVQQDAAIR